MNESDELEHRVASAIRRHGARLVAESGALLPGGMVVSQASPKGRTRLGPASLLIASIGLAVLALNAVGNRSTSSGGVPPSAVTGASNVVTATAGVTPSPVAVASSSSPGPSTPSAPSCVTAQLEAKGTRDAESGVVNIQVEFTNTGSTCALPSVPTAMSLVDGAGHRISLVARPAVGEPGGQVVVAPGPGPSAVLIGYWGNWCKAAPNGLTVVVTLTDPADKVSAALAGTQIPRCDDRTVGSWIQIDSINPE